MFSVLNFSDIFQCIDCITEYIVESLYNDMMHAEETVFVVAARNSI